MDDERNYRVTIAFDVEAETDNEAVEKASRASVVLNGEVIRTEVVSVENENWEEI